MKNVEKWPKLVSPPVDVLADEEISSAALRVALVLSSFDSNNKGLMWAHQDALAARARMTKRTIQRGLKSLREKGYTKRETIDIDGRSIAVELFLWSEQTRHANRDRVNQTDRLQATDPVASRRQIDRPKATNLSLQGDRSGPENDQIDRLESDRSGSEMTRSIALCPLLEFEDLIEDQIEEGAREAGAPDPNNSNSAVKTKTAESSPTRPDPSGAGARSVADGAQGPTPAETTAEAGDTDAAAAFFASARQAARGVR